MERKEYLELCQRCAVLQDGLLGTKINIPDELKVVYKGIQYRPKAYLLTFTQEEQGSITKRFITSLIRFLTQSTRRRKFSLDIPSTMGAKKI